MQVPSLHLLLLASRATLTFTGLQTTGATSHMIPQYAWMRNYTPYVVDIHLADNTVVQSAGIGSVVLNPVVNGSDARPVELTKVLHVPQLRNNLLSCLYLTKRKGIIMEVDASKIRFKRGRNDAVYSHCHPTSHRYCGCFN